MQALAGLHDHSRFHGDVKPDNLMVNMRPDGTDVVATLIDFGSASAFGTGGLSTSICYNKVHCITMIIAYASHPMHAVAVLTVSSLHLCLYIKVGLSHTKYVM